MVKMKRGRPTIRLQIQRHIIEILAEVGVPMTISSLAKKISVKMQRTISWNTVEKYMQELVKLEQIKAIQLPHSKVENTIGLTVYTIKK